MLSRRLLILLAASLAVVLLASGLIFQVGLAQTVTPTTPPGTTTPEATTPAATPTPIGGSDDGSASGRARTLTVTGVGEVNVQPDQAIVNIGVQTDADTAAEAMSQNAEQMDAVIQALVDAGVDEADIQTQFLGLHPRYNAPTEPAPGTPEIIGYTAVNTADVRVRDLAGLGDLLDTAITAGGNSINGIRFIASDDEETQGQALSNAMDNARSKAERLADLAGAELGPVIAINEGGGGAVPLSPELGLGGAVPIEPGSQTVRVTLQVTWELTD